MTSSTEQIDELLEWRAGSPEAATTNVFTALRWGVRRASRSKLLIFYLWLAYALIALGVGDAVRELLGGSSSVAEALRQISQTAGLGAAWQEPALRAIYRAVFLDSMARQLLVPSAFFLLFYGLFAGGIISFLHAPRPAPLLAQLGATCGAYVGRFARLLAIAAAALWSVIYIGSGVFGGASSGTTEWLQIGALLLTLWLLAAILDYARVRAVARDSRSMLLESGRSARFFVRNLPRTLALEVLFLVLMGVVGLLTLQLVTGLEMVFSRHTAAVLGAQVLMLSMLWIRLVAWGAMLALYQGIALQRWSSKQD